MISGLRTQQAHSKLYVPFLFTFLRTHLRRPSPDSIDPNGLNNPQYPWNIVNGAAGHYDGLDTLLTPLPYWTDQAFDT
jgi:hypothetical protein